MDRVWIDGEIVAAEEARIDALAAGVLTGTGVFESMKVLRGDAFALRRHLARLARSAEIVGLERPDDATLRDAVETVLAGRPDATRVRITVAAGRTGARPITIVHAEHTDPWAAHAHVVLSPWIRNERSPSSGAKTTSYVDNVLARRDALARGADEAVFCDTRGHLSEGTASNLFVEVDGRLCTPSLDNGCLGGMTRELLLELVPVDVRDDLTPDHLAAASEAFLTSSTRDVHPIATLDGHTLPAVPGPLTTAAAEAMAALQVRTTDP